MTIAHTRQRHCMNLLKKKIKFAPVISIQGARQVGKSFLASQLLPHVLKDTTYATLDERDNRKFADTNPNSFLKQHSSRHFIIDEVQKVPDLFDEIKAIVDKNRTPGQFIILGSTEFSHETNIRESLTGRMTKIKLYPLSLAETQKIDLNPQKMFPFLLNKPRVGRSSLLTYLNHGGLPGIFSVRNDSERKSLVEDWIKLTVERDIHQITKYKLDSSVAFRILEAIAKLNEPSIAQIANEVGISPKRIQNHINSLKALFVVFEVTPFKKSAGKAMHYLTDPVLLKYFDASFERKLTTWMYLELKSQLSYKGLEELEINFFKSTTGSLVHAVVGFKSELFVIKLGFQQSLDKRDLLIFETIKKKYKEFYNKFHFYFLHGGENYFKLDDIEICPWEAIV